MTTPRPSRTTIAGARARFAGVATDALNVSSTGALIRTKHQHPIGTECPLLFEVGNTPVELTARVVRCEPVAGPLSTSTGLYTLTLTFVNPSGAALERLEQVCQTGPRDEVDVRRLHVSLVRRCPKCHSRDVAKEGRRSYSCGQCGQMFTGFRIGILRFAR